MWHGVILNSLFGACCTQLQSLFLNHCVFFNIQVDSLLLRSSIWVDPWLLEVISYSGKTLESWENIELVFLCYFTKLKIQGISYFFSKMLLGWKERYMMTEIAETVCGSLPDCVFQWLFLGFPICWLVETHLPYSRLYSLVKLGLVAFCSARLTESCCDVLGNAFLCCLLSWCITCWCKVALGSRRGKALTKYTFFTQVTFLNFLQVCLCVFAFYSLYQGHVSEKRAV